MGSLEAKKALQKRSNLCVVIAILGVTLASLTPTVLDATSSLCMAVALVFGAIGLVTWIIGLTSYAQSKGYSTVIGLICLLGLIGLVILLLLPDRWKVVAPPVDGPTNYPRDPKRL